MKELFLSILNASLHGSIVIAAVLILRLVLKKAPRALFCLLWLLAGLRLVLPFEIESRLSLQPDMEPVVLNQTVVIPATAETPDVQLPLPQEEMPADTQQEAPREQTGFVYIEENGTVRVPELGDILCWVWLAGTAVMLTGSMISYFRLKHRLREAWKTEDGAWTCPELDTAFVLGILKPRIYLPAGLKEPERGLILAHEHGHIARGDHWYKPVGYCVLAIHWFNPLVWLAYLCLCRDIEMACDERVVKGMDLADRKNYATALLNCGGHTARIAACPVAFGETSVKQRIVSVLNYRKPGFWVMVAAVVALVFVVACLMTSPVKKQPEVPDIHDGANWGITFSAENVTPRGMTLVCEQDGTPVPGMLMTGAFFRLEKLTEDGWRELPTLQDAIFTTEGWVITNGQPHRWDVNWAWLYGELEPGRYHIFKIITLDETWGSETDWNGGVEFTITEEMVQGEKETATEYTEEEALARCREVLKQYQAQESWCIAIDRTFSGPGRTNPTSSQIWYIAGDDFLLSSVVPDDGGIACWYDLCKDGNGYSRMTYMSNEDGTGENNDSGWQVGLTNGQEPSLPWLVTLDWDTAGIEFVKVAANGISDLITFKVQGSPFVSDDIHVEEYEVTFWLRGDDELWKVEMAYTQQYDVSYRGELSPETVFVYAEITPEVSSPEGAAERIDTCYQQACQHIDEVRNCTDPNCTDPTHDHYGISCTVEHCTDPNHGHGHHD